jgi:hypothetical protein
MDIPAQSSVELHYTIPVPEDMGLSGTYWSMLMIEGINAENAQTPEGKNKIALNQIMRYGIQVVTNIGLSGEKKLEFKKTKLVKNPGKRILEEDLENIGERWLTPVLWVELYDKSGELKGRFQGGNSRIYPQTSSRFKVDLSSVKEGEYKALIIADCGGEDVYGISSKLKISDIEEPAPKVEAAAPVPEDVPKPVPLPASLPRSMAEPEPVPISLPWAVIGFAGMVLLALIQRKRAAACFNRVVNLVRAVTAESAPVPSPAASAEVSSRADKRRVLKTPAIDIFEAVNILVDDAHLLALNSEAIAARVSARKETIGDYREELKSLILAAIDSLDYTVLFIEGYLDRDKSDRADSGQYYKVMQTVIDNYNKVADTMSFVAQATQLINPPTENAVTTEPAVSRKQLVSQADALRDMAGKLKQVVEAG